MTLTRPRSRARRNRSALIALSLCVGALGVPVSAPAPAAASNGGFWSIARDIFRRSAEPESPVFTGLSSADAEAGLRAALELGAERAATRLSAPGGFWTAADVRIPLPDQLARAQSTLAPLRLSGPLDDLEERMNRAAEAAAGEAATLVVTAVREMTVQDALSLVSGGDTAATAYLRARTEDQLAARFAPVVEVALSDVGALEVLDTTARRFDLGAYSTDTRGRLIDHVVAGTIDAVFVRIGEEEAAIRANPAGQASDLLRRVFSQ